MSALIPSFTPILPQWRGNTSSEDMNTNFEEVLYDLNTVFSEASNIVIDLNELESRIRHDVEAISSRLYAVSGLMSAYEQSTPGYKIFYEDFYLPDQIIFPTNLTETDQCVVSDEFGVATLPVNNSFSKVYTINITDGEAIVAPDLSVEIVTLDEVGNVGIEETSPTRAFDGQDDTVWERKVRYNRDSTKTSSRCMMTATLPSMSNPYVNKIHIKPYPEGMGDVQMIAYDTLVSQDLVLPSFPIDGINNVGTTMYSFNNIQPTKIKVYFRQRSSRIEDDYKTFVYGAKEIGIEKVEYRSSGKVGFKFKLPDYDTGLINLLTSLRTDPSYDNITYKISLYTSEAEFNNDLPVWTSSNSPITVTSPLDLSTYGLSTLWAMAELIQAQGDTRSPLLRSISITYTTA